MPRWQAGQRSLQSWGPRGSTVQCCLPGDHLWMGPTEHGADLRGASRSVPAALADLTWPYPLSPRRSTLPAPNSCSVRLSGCHGPPCASGDLAAELLQEHGSALECPPLGTLQGPSASPDSCDSCVGIPMPTWTLSPWGRHVARARSGREHETELKGSLSLGPLMKAEGREVWAMRLCPVASRVSGPVGQSGG